MTLASIAQAIHRLPADKRVRLFDSVHSELEDYLLSKIAHDRFRKASAKRIAWGDVKR